MFYWWCWEIGGFSVVPRLIYSHLLSVFFGNCKTWFIVNVMKDMNIYFRPKVRFLLGSSELELC